MTAYLTQVPAPVRRAAYTALFVSLVHIVFGAIVRITGSGMGCGDHWPKCHGYWFPPLDRPDLIIEITHRWLAIALFVAIAAFVAAAWKARTLPGIRGRGGVWPVALAALGLWFAPALFGAITVFLENPAWATVVHKVLAAALLGVLIIAVIRSGGMGAATSVSSGITRAGTMKAFGAARSAAIGALLVIIMGGMTAKLEGAAVACAGFPLCGDGSLGGGAQHVQLTHRILAYLLVLHLAALPFIFAKRRESPMVIRFAWLALALGALQIVWAAWMVLGGFPMVVRSLHQATGIFIWVATFAMAYHARIAAGGTTLTHPSTGSTIPRDIATEAR
jgi:heme A synthase